MPTPKTIQEWLDHFEQHFDIRILYACEAGSRGRDAHHAFSDHDVAFVYVNGPKAATRPWIIQRQDPDGQSISILPPANQASLDAGYFAQFEELAGTNFQFQGQRLDKFLGHIAYSDPNAFRWHSSQVVYRTADGWSAIAKFMDPYWNWKKIVTSHYRQARQAIHYSSSNLPSDQVGIETMLHAAKRLLQASAHLHEALQSALVVKHSPIMEHCIKKSSTVLAGHTIPALRVLPLTASTIGGAATHDTLRRALQSLEHTLTLLADLPPSLPEPAYLPDSAQLAALAYMLGQSTHIERPCSPAEQDGQQCSV